MVTKKLESGTDDKQLQPEKIRIKLGVSVLVSPKIQSHGGQLVHYGYGAAVPSQIHGLDVGLATVARFHAHVKEIGCRENWKLVLVFRSTARAKYAAKRPFSRADGTEKRALCSIALSAQNADHRPGIAEGAGWGVRLE